MQISLPHRIHLLDPHPDGLQIRKDRLSSVVAVLLNGDFELTRIKNTESLRDRNKDLSTLLTLNDDNDTLTGNAGMLGAEELVIVPGSPTSGAGSLLDKGLSEPSKAKFESHALLLISSSRSWRDSSRHYDPSTMILKVHVVHVFTDHCEASAMELLSRRERCRLWRTRLESRTLVRDRHDKHPIRKL
jgi:hypothetical protein